MTRRERVMEALSFRTPDRLPKDLGGMRSTGISCFAYPRLVKALGLPERLPKVHDTGQMLALPDADVLDALDCDVVAVETDQCTNAFEEPSKWKPLDFGGRLPALVMHPEDFSVCEDGTALQRPDKRMPPGSYVFDSPHAGQVLDLAAELAREDLDELREQFESERYTSDRIESIARYCRRARESTDRAIFFAGLSVSLRFRGGIPHWSMMCMTDPDHVKAVHEVVTAHAIEEAERLLPAIRESVDVLMLNSNDLGLQNTTILPPEVFRELFVPFYRRFNDAVAALAPGVKRFLHCCGAVYDILDDIVDCGFEVLNPVQWSAGGHSYEEWKRRTDGKIALWGGGINSQTTLPLGTIEDVAAEVTEVVRTMSRGNGYVFNSTHNILAEIPAEKVIAMYRTAAEATAL